MVTFDELASSRRNWIDSILRPWCRQATLSDLKRAELDWTNIAGDVDPHATLWAWAWVRFSGLVNEELGGLEETYPVRVTLKDGTHLIGYPDNRQSRRGQLVLLLPPDNKEPAYHDSPPHSIDQVASAERVET